MTKTSQPIAETTPPPTTTHHQQQKHQQHAPNATRHLEKRRTGTCQFADRIARHSLQTYRRRIIPSSRQRDDNDPTEAPTCVATIVAHYSSDDYLQIVGLGVGTKFLSERLLREEEGGEDGCGKLSRSSVSYGRRVRDCHAEVLARRAFRRRLCDEILEDLKSDGNDDDGGGGGAIAAADGSSSTIHNTLRPLLRRTPASSLQTQGHNNNNSISYELLPGITLHMYSSSAPCGNATLKRFAKMKREVYDATLGVNQWPTTKHEEINAHSIRLGQFSLLVKKNAVDDTPSRQRHDNNSKFAVNKRWPANENDEWCPPGTSIIGKGKGTILTCSDKICRWNCLGWQGSLLSSFIQRPLYVASLTIARKMTGCICRRALCCRGSGFRFQEPEEKMPKEQQQQEGGENIEEKVLSYAVNHPAIMGTSVYMNEDAAINMSNSTLIGQDVRFESHLCYAWYPRIIECQPECIDARTGFIASTSESKDGVISEVSTEMFIKLYNQIATLTTSRRGELIADKINNNWTLAKLRLLKRRASPKYEAAKDELLTKHRVFRRWDRRETRIEDDEGR